MSQTLFGDRFGKRSLLESTEHEMEESLGLPAPTPPRRDRRKIVYYALLVAVLAAIVTTGVLIVTHKKNLDVFPTRIRMGLPTDPPAKVVLGESRVVDVLFYSGHDDRNRDDFLVVTHRGTLWSTRPEGVVTVDPYGRMETLKAGQARIRVQSTADAAIFDEKTIEVIAAPEFRMGGAKRVSHFQGQPAAPVQNLQKLVDRFKREVVQESEEIPESIKKVSLHPEDSQKKLEVKQGDVSWEVAKYADGSNGTYVRRTNGSQQSGRDQVQYFIGSRYLPGDGRAALSIEDDGANGLWVAGREGDVTHIDMVGMSYSEKAELMAANTRKYVMRYGLASDASWNGSHWVPTISDNDGLWTSMYGAGELMRYAYLRQAQPGEKAKEARESALTSLKAVLLIANVAGRDKVIDAKLRHLLNTRSGKGQYQSKQYLKIGAPFAIEDYVLSASNGQELFGIDAGKTVDGNYYGGEMKYTYNPLVDGDWTTTEPPALTKRNLKGFISRTFVIPELDGTIDDNDGGLFFKRNQDGTQTVLSGAHELYDGYKKSDHPTFNLGNADIPEVLKDILKIGRRQFDKSDMIYKGQTSTDEVIGHLFIYKTAFDILDENDPEEKELKELLVKTVINFCTHLLNNGYQMVDATGYGTKWSKLNRNFVGSDFTFEDGPLKVLELLMSLKLCAYVSGDQRWQDQYTFLIQDESYKYLDLVALVWKRWVWRAYNEDYDSSQKLFRLNSTDKIQEEELIRHVMYGIHYSDQEEAMLGFYLAFQMEKNQQYLKKYRIAIDGWWHSISRSENPLWYYIYQLAYPNQKIQDSFKSNILEVSSWQLSRHPVETRKSQAYIFGSRSDVLLESIYGPILSIDPLIQIGSRKSSSDTVYAATRPLNNKIFANYNPSKIYQIKILPADERSIHKFNGATFENIQGENFNGFQSSTTFTLPFWLGVYHKMIEFS